MTLQDRCRAALARSPSRAAVEYEGRWRTWGEMAAVADQLTELLSQAGVAPDAPVGFAPRNRPSALAAELALLARGQIIRMIYAFQSPVGLARDIDRLGVSAIIASQDDFTPEVLEVVRARGLAAITLSDMSAQLVHSPDAPAEVETGTSRPRIDVLTSGTTGPPKHVPFSYDMILQEMVGINVSYSGDEDENIAPAFLYFPLGNISGVYTVLPPLLKGQRAVLVDRFSIEGWQDYVVRFRPTFASIPPAGVRMALDMPIPREDLSSIQVLMTGAAPLDPTIQRAFEEAYGIPVLLSYGATEFGGPVTLMTPELYAEFGKAKLGSVGRPFAGAQLRVVDPETGVELPAGQEGRLEVIAPRIGPDWIVTSDIARLDEDGFLYHCGRADGAIVRGGFKLLPDVIERALCLRPEISAAAVVGVSDPRLGQVPAAAIQLRPGLARPDVATLEAHLREQVYATHIPTTWVFVDALPRTPSFKIDLPAVRRLFEAAAPQAAEPAA